MTGKNHRIVTIQALRKRLPFYEWLMRLRPAWLAVAIKRLMGLRLCIVEVAEGRLLVDPASIGGVQLLRGVEGEPHTMRAIRRHLPKGGVFVDLGANAGLFSIAAWRRAGPGGRIVAVEPQRRLVPVIEANFELNGVRNATIVQKAVSDSCGTCRLYLSPDVNTGSSSLQRVTRYPVPAQETETVTLEVLLDECGVQRADVLKMDIEGFEYEAILGAPAVFRQGRVGVLVLEYHPALILKRGLDPRKIPDLLRECGYRHTKETGADVFVAPGSSEPSNPGGSGSHESPAGCSGFSERADPCNQ